ncbi:hypothetical protein ACHAXR_001547 [Thalassiosira sp. AJA248-18]
MIEDDVDDDICIAQQRNQSNDCDKKSWHILPLSRVLLRGIATAIDRRPNGCTLIVLDDGTGSIDCIYWDDSHSGDSAFNLPSLLPEHEKINKRRGFRFVVGDSLEVMGKIKALTAGCTNNNGECKLSGGSANSLEVRYGCVREVHAKSVCLVGEGQTRNANQGNGEVVHWLKCMNFSRSLASQCNEIDDTKNNPCTVRNGKGVLPLLGGAITSSILSDGSSDFTNLDNTMGNQNILHRKCCQTPHRFRKALFYCHCEATLEALDPTFRFRDAILNRLLDTEAQLHRSSDSCYPSATEDCMDLFGAQSDSMPPPLLFTFESMFNDKELTSIACEIVASTNLPEANAQRLVRKTFAAMTNDGILSLYDHEQDLYLLVSCTRVMEPFLRRSKGMGDGGFGAGLQIPQPFFIRSVPKKRIEAIMNWWLTEMFVNINKV